MCVLCVYALTDNVYVVVYCVRGYACVLYLYVCVMYTLLTVMSFYVNVSGLPQE